MNEINGDIASVRVGQSAGRLIGPRAYNLIFSGLIFAGLSVMSLGFYLVKMPGFETWITVYVHPYMICSFVGIIAGIILMNVAVKRQAVVRSLIGFALFVGAFGATLSLLALVYDMEVINSALFATAVITVVFGALGVAFPRVFQRIVGVLSVSLLALLVVQMVTMFMGMDQMWLDIAVVVVFCGFIGYDMHAATSVAPTVPNAVFMACNLFLDIVNVFTRLVRILGDDR